MKLLYAKITESEDLLITKDCLLLKCIRPTIIHPSEVVIINTGIRLEVEKGFVIYLTTHPNLAKRLGEIFPASTVLIPSAIEDAHEDIRIPVHNIGRNPINIMPGDLVALGYAVRVEPIETEEFNFGLIPQESPKSKPQKKNPGIRFELKN